MDYRLATLALQRHTFLMRLSQLMCRRGRNGGSREAVGPYPPRCIVTQSS
jgi:hypothetical protein